MRIINLFAVIAGALALSGCFATVPEVIKLKPPVDLLQDCEHPAYGVRTNADIANGLLAYQDALDKCNIDKAALRAWMEG